MRRVEVQPILLRDATLTIGDDDFSAGVGEAAFVPSAEWVTDVDLRGVVRASLTSVEWTLALSHLQDDAAASLTRYLLEHAGAVRATVLTLRAGGVAWAADVVMVPGPVGGTPDALLTASVTLPLVGSPAPVG